MPFWQFLRNWPLDWIAHALLVQPSISACRKWPEMVVSASTNQVWTKITIKGYAWSFAIQIQIQALWTATVWQVLNVKQMETEIIWICWILFGKICEITSSELIFGGFEPQTTVARAAIFAHCMHCNLHSAVHSTLWLPCGALAVHWAACYLYCAPVCTVRTSVGRS